MCAVCRIDLTPPGLCITDKSTNESSFYKAPVDCLQWSYRKELLIQEMTTSQSDIVCLEEVDHFPDFIKPSLEQHGYKGFFFPKPSSPCLNFSSNSGPDGCALFFKSSSLAFLQKEELTLTIGDEEPSNQVAIIVRMEHIQSKHRLCAVVTHLKAKQGFDQERLLQGQNLLSAVTKFASGDPFIICGDFNAKPAEPVHSYFTGFSAPSLSSAYAVALGQEPKFTSWKFRPHGEYKYCIDYIWFTMDHFKLLKVLEIPSADQIGPDGLPCPVYPSDHIALCAQFNIQ